MPHIKSITLKNFKSHSDSIIEFDQITSIIGRNNAGKSNVFRALKLLLHNGDWPATWIRYGQTSASIEVELFSGIKVTRKRTKSGQVIIIQEKGKITEYEGKKDATEFIEKAIGIKKITLDETSGPEDLNFVEVNEGPYLLGGRSDTIQRKICGIVGANAIDDARVRLTKKLREKETRVTFLSKSIDELGNRLETDRPKLESINNLLQYIESLDKQRNESEAKLAEAKKFRDQFHEISLNIPNNNVVINIDNGISTIKTILQKLNEYQVVIKLLRDLDSLNNQLTKDREVENQILSLDNLKASIHQLQSNTESIKEFLSIVTELETVDEEKQKVEQEIETLLNLKIDKLKELGVCPMCSQKVQ